MKQSYISNKREIKQKETTKKNIQHVIFHEAVARWIDQVHFTLSCLHLNTQENVYKPLEKKNNLVKWLSLSPK